MNSAYPGLRDATNNEPDRSLLSRQNSTQNNSKNNNNLSENSQKDHL